MNRVRSVSTKVGRDLLHEVRGHSLCIHPKNAHAGSNTDTFCDRIVCAPLDQCEACCCRAVSDLAVFQLAEEPAALIDRHCFSGKRKSRINTLSISVVAERCCDEFQVFLLLYIVQDIGCDE